MDRHETNAWGLFGGKSGRSGSLHVMRAGETEWRTFREAFGTTSPNKFADIQLHRGDRVKIVSPGGGGYGAPLERDPELVAEDVREGLYSDAIARDVYRVALHTARGRIALDVPATSELRARSDNDGTAGAVG
jgi:5-oxoprolinase (ATP-hydrolysing)/N-methylhydantoinase B